MTAQAPAFTFEPTEVGRARLGRLTTAHGPIDTPQFMPVGTQATVKALTPGDLHAAGAQMILGNTYHLSLRPTAERIASLGGLHRFMGWDGPILTDSGGFQVFSLAHLRQVDDDGVTFTSHLDGSTHRLTPERAMEIQALLGSDVAMAFDQLVDPGLPRTEVAEAMARTHRWARAHRSTRVRPARPCTGSSRAASTPSCAGSRSAAIAGMPFDGIAVGGLSVGESKAQMATTLDVVAEALGDDPRPRYLMGVGSPGRLLRGGGARDRPLRLRPAHARRAHRTGLDRCGPPEPSKRRLPRRRRADRSGLRVRGVPRVLARVRRPPVPRARAARVPARDDPQRDLDARAHAPAAGLPGGRLASATLGSAVIGGVCASPAAAS